MTDCTCSSHQRTRELERERDEAIRLLRLVSAYTDLSPAYAADVRAFLAARQDGKRE